MRVCYYYYLLFLLLGCSSAESVVADGSSTNHFFYGRRVDSSGQDQREEYRINSLTITNTIANIITINTSRPLTHREIKQIHGIVGVNRMDKEGSYLYIVHIDPGADDDKLVMSISKIIME